MRGASKHNNLLNISRFERSIKDRHCISDALEDRNADLAERLVREHALDLATRVERNANYLA